MTSLTLRKTTSYLYDTFYLTSFFTLFFFIVLCIVLVYWWLVDGHSFLIPVPPDV